MSKIFPKKKLSLDSTLTQFNSSLQIFFYLTQTKREKIEYLAHFLKKYKLKIDFLTKEKRFSFSSYFQANANFVAQSTQTVSQSDFEAINSFLSIHVTIVSFSYQNQIWTVSRFLKWQQLLPQSFLLSATLKDTTNFSPDNYTNKLNQQQFIHLWLFFNQMSF